MLQQKNGFTLVEILVVIGIIAVLASMLLPSLSSARERAHMMTCINNLRQIGNAANQYTAIYDGWLIGGDGITLGCRGGGYLNEPVDNGTLWPFYENKETFICVRDGRKPGTFTWSYDLNFTSQLVYRGVFQIHLGQRGRHVTDIMYTSKLKYFVEENTDVDTPSPVGKDHIINDAIFCFSDYTGVQHGNTVAVNFVDGHAGTVPALAMENDPLFRTEPGSTD